MIISPHNVKRYWPYIISAAFIAIILSIVIAMSCGAAQISLYQVFQWLIGASDAYTDLILFNIRLPRVLLGLSIGALLASCGAATQGLFRNPLADPSLIGVSAGASMGASIVIVCLDHMSGSVWGLSLVSVGAFLGGILAAMLVYKMATGSSGTSVSTMLLAGIAITFFAGSLSSFLEFLADNEMLRRISLWRMGGLDTANYVHVIIAVTVTFIILVILMRYTHALNAFLLGESEARHLGVNIVQVKKILIICVAAGVGISVALVGTIAFVGLIVPHIIRLFFGPNHRYLLPLCACFGSVLLVLADALTRILLSPTELPVGIITSFVGAPIFILLLRHRYQYGMRS